jgi:raffinose/stachyose/melibiose transport system substrate-binding protein
VKARSVFAALALVALVAGCGAPGDDDDNAAQSTPTATAEAKPDISKAGNVTLTVWDQEVRGGQRAQITELNKQFEAKYPNVKIERVARSFDDLIKTVKLAASGDDAPDVLQANQGLGIMGELVKAKLLRPVSDYSKVYGWDERWAPVLLQANSVEPDGSRFGSGDLYGVSQMGEIVGVYYNKDKVQTPPTTLEEFEASLQEAKDAGDVPIQFGNSDAWPGIHNYETVLGQIAGKQPVRDFVFSVPGSTFDNPLFTEAAQKLTDWVDKGYFNENFNGTGYDPAWQNFAKGEGRYLIAGTWLTADLEERMGDKVGFMLMPGKSPDAPVALGGESLAFAISSKAEQPDVAAAYLDFLTDANAGQVLVDTGNLPAMKGAPVASSGLNAEVGAAWQKLNESDGVIPYLDWTTPTFFDDISASIQELLDGKQQPAEFTSGVQEAYSEWAESN